MKSSNLEEELYTVRRFCAECDRKQTELILQREFNANLVWPFLAIETELYHLGAIEEFQHGD